MKQERARKVGPFCFEESWIFSEDCRPIVDQIWSDTQHVPNHVQRKFDCCQMQFGIWRVATVSGVQKELQSKAQLLYHSQVNGDANNVEDVPQLRKDIATLLKQEELAWKQRAKQQWLKHEDQNSRFFH